MVLGNDGLLGDILLRVDSPTTLVRAALVSKRWYGGASFPAFLRRFRELNPPRLLGIYVSGEGLPRPEFVQVPTPQPADHAAAARRANFGFAADFAEFSSTVWDCRNGRVLYESGDAFHLAVRVPLRYPGHDLLAPLPPPPGDLRERAPHAMLLPDGDDDVTCYRVDIGVWNEVAAAKVHALRSDGEWSVRCSAAERLVAWPGRILAGPTLLAGGKVYFMAAAGFVLGLDMAAARFFVVDFPDGVALEHGGGNVVPCRGDGGALYLVHLKGDELSVWWLRAADGSEWVLKNTVSVKGTCADFIPQEQGPEQAPDGDAPPAEEGAEPPADGGDDDAPVEVGPEPPADGGDDDALIEVVPEPVVDGGNALVEVGPEPPANGGAAPEPTEVVGVGDNAEFVFLELGGSGVIVYLHLGSKKVEKVYQRDPDDDNVIRVHPFLMVWPPTFPALREGEGEAEAEE